jgi:hypothetical protein
MKRCLYIFLISTIIVTPLYVVFGCEWNIQSVDNQGQSYNSLDLDSVGNPHIAYYVSQPQPALKYAVQDSNNWHTQTVANNCGRYASLRLNKTGNPKIAHASSQFGLLYSYLSNDSWYVTQIDPITTCVDVSLGLDSSGNPNISYISGTFSPNDTQRLKFTHTNDSIWKIDTLASIIFYIGGSGEFVSTSFEFDNENNPHFIFGEKYCNYVSSTTYIYISYGYLLNNIWHFSTAYYRGFIDTDVSIGRLALKFAHNNQPRITFNYNPNGWYTPAAYFTYYSLDSNWRAILLPDTFANNLSIALDSFGRAHIAYIMQNRLMYAIYLGNNQWQYDTVTTGSISGNVSLQLDRFDHPHICFFSNGLKYAYGTPTAIEEEEIALPFGSAKTNVIVYPNPATTYFTVRFPLTANRQEIKIYDVTGKVVNELMGSGVGELKVPLDGIKNGVYFVKVGNKLLSEKIIVSK